jgi:phosphohistidine phosphatase
MKLYILRHASAVDRDPDEYPDDSQRPLTREGHEKMMKIAYALRKLDKRIDLILSSPALRARETAEIVRKQLHLKKDRLILIDQLSPLGDLSKLIEEILLKYDFDRIVLVGHEPDLSMLISMLISGDTTLSVTMKKGGICCLNVEQLAAGKCATLEWLINPAQFVSLEFHGSTAR